MRTVPATEGGVTVHIPSGLQMSIYDAAMKYQAESTPLDHPIGQGIRRGLVARLGRERHRAARRQGRDRGELRAHPSLEPDRHGRRAAAVPRRRDGRDASGSRATEIFDIEGLELARAKEVTVTATDADGKKKTFTPSYASTRRRSRTTSSTAASCSTCCASSPRRSKPRSAHEARGCPPGSVAARTRRGRSRPRAGRHRRRRGARAALPAVASTRWITAAAACVRDRTWAWASTGRASPKCYGSSHRRRPGRGPSSAIRRSTR